MDLRSRTLGTYYLMSSFLSPFYKIIRQPVSNLLFFLTNFLSVFIQLNEFALKDLLFRAFIDHFRVDYTLRTLSVSHESF